MCRVLGIYGSPRMAGNSDRLLDEALRGATSAGAEVSTIKVRDLDLSGGCGACGSCERTGACVIQDDMARVYPLLSASRAVILASPVHFLGLSAQVKALIDRCQCLWWKRQQPALSKGISRRGMGYLICVAGSEAGNVFAGCEATARALYDCLDMGYAGGLLVRGVDRSGEILGRPQALKDAFLLGGRAADPERR